MHPLLCYLDGSNEPLAAILRPGNAGAGTAADHVRVLDQALAQLPVAPKGIDPERGEWMLMRSDSAGCSHEFLDALRVRGVEFSVGFTLTEDVRNACLSVPERTWADAVTSDGADIREHAQVAEITDRLDLSGWPQGTRAVARREEPHPGAQLTFTDEGGHRFQVFIPQVAPDRFPAQPFLVRHPDPPCSSDEQKVKGRDDTAAIIYCTMSCGNDVEGY